MTPAEELRAAAQALREAAKDTTSTEGGWGGSTDEEHGTAFIFGGPVDEAGYRTGIVFEFKDELDCENCARPSFADVGWMITATPALAEPLAKWLESTALLARTHKTDPDYEAKNRFRWCLECNNEECEALQHIDKALAVARVINGGPPTVWSDAVPPGGMVCAVYAPGRPDDICGTPVESEPCPTHGSAL